ncbi:DUF2304 domain-containing protein [Paenibacillus sp. J2TS4]|uniref:DUF2304 domain-containing protein n=1 Tax=Paenibacillus sp. J2TS4 TaxID=2807194 RepID=UPI001B0EE75B|nr:DUF2304 domain-containing protein [Paenibacillus sp. J2TS4]GIP32848.1 hypothetical protein J2TS4_20580 [Paenibacillus sp. J2TS4]
MNIYLLSIIFSLFFLVVTLELIRRQKVAERYSLLWLILALVMLVSSIFPGWLNAVSRLVNVYYAPSLLFLVGFIFSLLLIMHLTIVITRLQRQVTRMIQEVALLKAQKGREEAPDDGSAHRPG